MVVPALLFTILLQMALVGLLWQAAVTGEHVVLCHALRAGHCPPRHVQFMTAAAAGLGLPCSPPLCSAGRNCCVASLRHLLCCQRAQPKPTAPLALITTAVFLLQVMLL
jgi:hypothetical protein